MPSNRRVQSRPERVRSRAAPRSTRQRNRYPSYLISWIHPSPSGGEETRVASCGAAHLGSAARRAPVRDAGSSAAAAEARRLFEFQIRGPTSSIVRPLFTLSGRSTKMSFAARFLDPGSRSLIRSQFFLPSSPARPDMRISAHRPESFFAWSSNSSFPRRRPSCGSTSGVQVPRSQRSTEPPPYWPFGILPSKDPYSSGWSSTSTARRFSPGSRLGPLGTAQLLSTPSSSRRKS